MSIAYHKSLHLNLNSDGLPDTTKQAAKWSLPFQKINPINPNNQGKIKRSVIMNNKNIINSYETRYGNEVQNTPFPQD